MKFIFLFIDQWMTQKTYIAKKNEEETRYLLPEQKNNNAWSSRINVTILLLNEYTRVKFTHLAVTMPWKKFFVSSHRFWIFKNNPLIVAVVTAQQQPQQQNNQNCSGVETK